MVGSSVPAPLTLANWDLGGEPSAWAYRHAGELFPHAEIPTAGPAATLPLAELGAVARFPVGQALTLDEYVGAGPVGGVVIVHRGRIIYERYPRMQPGKRHLLMSVSKVFVAVLIGILEQRGVLDLTEPVDALIAELATAGWADVRVDHILNMRSGIDCLEVDDPASYTDPEHPFYRFEASLGWRPADRPVPSTYDLVAALPARRPPDQAYEYTGVNTFVLSWLVERVTGSPFAEALGRELWARAGFESSAQLCVSTAGAPASHGGLSTTLRDLARFGMLFTPSYHLVAESVVVDREHLRRIQTGGRADPFSGQPRLPGYATGAYGDQLPPASRQWNFAMVDGDLFKGGFGGQGLYVSPVRDLVVAFAGAPRADGSVNLLRWYSRRIATGLFPEPGP